MCLSLTRRLSWTITAGSLALLATMPIANAEHASSKRLALFAKLPNWTGVWEATPANAIPTNDAASNAQNAPGNTNGHAELPYNATWKAKYAAALKQPTSSTKKLPSLDNSLTQCTWGIPRLLRGPHVFAVTALPEQTFFAYDVSEFRHIWTDGRKHPTHATPTSTGHAIGHWQGETLIVDTVALKSGTWVNSKGAILSPKAVVQERWSQPDNDHLKVDVSIQDLLAFTQPYNFTRHYQRNTDSNRMTQQDCLDKNHEAPEGDKP